MNYGKKSVKQKKKALQSKSTRWGRKFLLLFLRAFLLLFIGAGIIGISLGIGVFKGIIDSAPTINLADATPSRFSSFIYDAKGNQIKKLVAEDSNRVPVTMEQIPQNLADAFVALEDSRFYEHNGIDIQGILRAGVVAVTSGFQRKEGASTITQQLIKNTILTTWTSEKTLPEQAKRKIQEQYLAIQLEKSAGDKSKILEQYMNTINLGQNTLGVQAASKRYFNKNVWELTLSECAAIAGITQNPSRYNPISRPEKNAERRQKTLDDMKEQGYITQAEYDEAIADTEDLYNRIQIANAEIAETSVDSYFVDAVTEAVIEDLIAAGYNETQAYTLVYSGGIGIFSTMDPEIQAIADEVCSNEENYPDDTRWQISYRLTYRDPNKTENDGITNISTEMYRIWQIENVNKSFNLLYNSQDEAYAAVEAYKEATMPEGSEILGESISLVPQPQISLTVADQSTGEVVAMVGGRGTKEGSRTLNRAVDSMRQPGSTFKVVSTFAPAIDSAGMTLADVQLDAPYNYADGKPVANYYTGYRGLASLRDGIRDSMNIVTVKTLTQITPQLGYDYLLNFGFTTLESAKELNGKIYTDIQQPLALGGITNGVKNIELNAAYAAIANNGVYIKPKLYTIVKDHDGNILLDNTAIEGRQVIKPSTAFLLTSAMQDVFTSGTATLARFPGMSIAGKTGSTSDYKDVWLSAYSPYYTATAWVGYDNNTNMDNPEKQVSKIIWREVMKRIHENLENKPFDMPSDIVTATVCSRSGKLPNEALCGATLKIEYFTQDTVPTEICDVHYQGTICTYSAMPASPECPFKMEGIMEMPPENERILNGQTTVDGTASTSCPHDALFFSDPNAEAIVAMQNLELVLRTDQNQYPIRLAELQSQLEQAVTDKAVADARIAAAMDEETRITAENESQQAQNMIDHTNALIAQLQAAQNAAVAALAPATTADDGTAD